MDAIQTNTQLPLVLKNGRFLRGEEEMPIKIGDAEQIALVRAYDRLIEQGIDCDFSYDEDNCSYEYTAWCVFECICGRRKSDYIPHCGSYSLNTEPPDPEMDFQDRYMCCQHCKRIYLIDDGLAKLKQTN